MVKAEVPHVTLPMTKTWAEIARICILVESLRIWRGCALRGGFRHCAFVMVEVIVR